MKSNGLGWRFPPTNGGREDGFNDPGIAHFGGSRLASLARETIQNSLDARLDPSSPVHVSFELVHLVSEDIGGDELLAAIESCRQQRAADDSSVADALETAAGVLKSDKVTCLQVSDRNTTGLDGQRWHTLVKTQGVSHKPGAPGAGGSHGIGKYAPFAVSDLRTVFYWTSFREGRVAREWCQGKSVLMSHEDSDGMETQGTGFFGQRDGCAQLVGRDVPQCFRLTDPSGKPVLGTSIVIAGFRAMANWRHRVAASVIANYFHALRTGNLTVMLEPDDDDDTSLFEITADSLSDWFAKLGVGLEASDTVEREEIQLARRLSGLLDDDPTFETQDADLGHCRLWVRVSDGLPSKVAFVRRTGMLITTRQAKLLRFPGYREFVALCVFEDPDGNELLRKMENPTHDQFEPERLPETDRSRGRQALTRITKWIRKSLREVAGPPAGGHRIALRELATYLPLHDPEESFDGHDQDGDQRAPEPGFGSHPVVALRPIRRPSFPELVNRLGDAKDGDGDGEEEGERGGGGTGGNGGGGGSGGEGDGTGEGGTGNRGGAGSAGRIPISRVRMIPMADDPNAYRLSFRSEDEGIARLVLEEAGDSTAVPRDDVRCIQGDASLSRVPVARGERTTIEITADRPLGGRAWRLSAYSVRGAS